MAGAMLHLDRPPAGVLPAAEGLGGVLAFVPYLGMPVAGGELGEGRHFPWAICVNREIKKGPGVCNLIQDSVHTFSFSSLILLKK